MAAVSSAARITVSASIGAREAILITRVSSPSFERIFAASSARHTTVPQAIRVASFPGRNVCARPGSKISEASVTSGTGVREILRKAGLGASAAHRTAAVVWRASAGTTIFNPSMARSQAMSSIEWCVAPNSPYAKPGLMPHNFTFAALYATSALICSRARPVKKGDAAQTKGMRPALANPALTPTIFCSAIPTLTSRSGKSSLNSPRKLDPTESLHTATMRSSLPANSTSVAAKGFRQSIASSFVIWLHSAPRAPGRIDRRSVLCDAIRPGSP